MADITLTQLTTKSLTGTGVFDNLMGAVQIHLDDQFEQGRIKGTDYANVYLGSVQAVLQQSIAFLLGEQAADKQAELLIAQTSLTAKQESELGLNGTIEREKLEEEIDLLQTQDVELTLNGVSDRDLKSAQITETNAKELLIENQTTELELNGVKERSLIDEKIIASQHNTSNADEQSNQDLLNKQEQIIASEAKTTRDDTDSTRKNLLIEEQILASSAKTIRDDAENTAKIDLMGEQEQKTLAEQWLLRYKAQTEIAQTSDEIPALHYTDGTPRVLGTVPVDRDSGWYDTDGVIGRQRALYTNQAEGFIQDSRQKAVKAATDVFAVAKTAQVETTTPGIVDTGTPATDGATGLNNALQNLLSNADVNFASVDP